MTRIFQPKAKQSRNVFYQEQIITKFILCSTVSNKAQLFACRRAPETDRNLVILQSTTVNFLTSKPSIYEQNSNNDVIL